MSEIVVETKAGIDGLPAGFADLPRAIYANDPLWIPEDAAALATAFSPANPWFASGNEAVTFCVPGHARAAAFAPKDLKIGGERAAYVGFFETADRTESASAADAAVMAAVEKWTRERGAVKLGGPVNFTTAGNYRLRLAVEANADAVPFVDEPYNPANYPAIFAALGFSLAQKYLTQISPLPEQRRAEKRPEVAALLAAGFQFLPITADLWLSRLDDLREVVNAAFAENPGFTAFSTASFAANCGENLVRKACPETSVLALSPDGGAVGFFLVYPHYGPLVIQRAGAARVAVSELSHAAHFEKLRAMNGGEVDAVAKTIAVRPDFRRHGIMNAMTLMAWDRGENLYRVWYAALIREDNASRRPGLQSAFAERTYGLFAKPIV